MNNIEDFINVVFCRRETSQYKANLVWEKIKFQFPKEKQHEFETDWFHYVNNSLDFKGLGKSLIELKKNKIK